jgi:hypothetical protein
MGKDILDKPGQQKLIKVSNDDMKAFTELPPPAGKDFRDQQKAAHDLFNLFTADIIREEKLFVR